MSSYLEALQKMSHDDLVNDLYNRRVSEWSDYEQNSEYSSPTGKRIPYIGWFWRDTDFAGKKIRIGDTGGFIGVMESNKWGYPERVMTEQEVDTFIGFLERGFSYENADVNEKKPKARAEEEFRKLYDWFQTLEIPEE